MTREIGMVIKNTYYENKDLIVTIHNLIKAKDKATLLEISIYFRETILPKLNKLIIEENIIGLNYDNIKNMINDFFEYLVENNKMPDYSVELNKLSFALEEFRFEHYIKPKQG